MDLKTQTTQTDYLHDLLKIPFVISSCNPHKQSQMYTNARLTCLIILDTLFIQILIIMFGSIINKIFCSFGADKCLFIHHANLCSN